MRPLKECMPGIEGIWGSQVWPVAWMIWRGYRVLVSEMPLSRLRIRETSHLNPSHLAVWRVVEVQIFSFMAWA